MAASSKNIIGENFSPDLIQQINTRQEKLGKSKLESGEIVMNNSKTAWLRLTSGVKVNEGLTKAGLANFSNTEDPLAEEFVLFGGVISARGKEDITDLSFDPLNIPLSVNSNYGIGDNTQWGYGPPPGITSMEIKAINRGAVRKAELMITAHNPDQFRIIEALYLRLGFTIMVEWGHSMYYDNNGEVQDMDFETAPFREFLDANGGAYEKLNNLNKTIINERKNYNYNYDAFVGFITNFTWSISPEGVYNINLSVLSPGALIESLTISRASDEQILQDEENLSSPNNIIEAWFDYWKEVFKKVTDNRVTKNVDPLPATVDDLKFFNLDGISINGSKINNVDPFANEIFGFEFVKEGELLQRSVLGTDDSTEEQYYISLGAFLRFIEKNTLYYDKSQTPILGIDHEYQKSFMLSHPYQNSVDPNVCMLSSRIVDYDIPSYSTSPYVEREPTQLTYAQEEVAAFAATDTTGDAGASVSAAEAQFDYYQANPELFTVAEERERREAEEATEEEVTIIDDTFTPYQGPVSSSNRPTEEELSIQGTLSINTNTVLHFRDTGISSFEGYQGDIMGIMVNFDYITNLSNTIDKNASLYDFLERIFFDIEQTTGNINDLAVSYDVYTSKGTIYDSRSIPGVLPENPKQGSFHVNGFQSLNEDIGSFIKNFSFQTKVFPQLTNFVAIAAHTGEIPLPDEASSFQILNKGLVDRVMGTEQIAPSKKNNKLSTLEKYYTQIKDLNYYFKKIYYENQKRKGDAGAALKDILKYDLQVRCLNNEMVSPFFIPVDLSLTLDGLSGMTLWQQFGVTPDYILPPDYPDNLNFIIQGISHTIKDNEWTTTLNTLSWPSPNKEWSAIDQSLLKGGNDTPFSTTPPSPTPTEETPETTEWEVIPNGGDPQIRNKSGKLVTPREAVVVLHPNVRETFIMVFEDWLKLPQLKGYTLKIISDYRTFEHQQRLVRNGDTTTEPGKSPHNWGTGYDIEVHRNGAPVLVKGSEVEEWVATGMVEVARKYNLRWGGVDFGDYHDPVHFDVGINKTETLKNAEEYHINIYGRVPSNRDLAKLTQEEIYSNVDLVFA